MFLPGGRQIMQTAGIPVMKKQETEFFYKVIETTIQQVIEGKQIRKGNFKTFYVSPEEVNWHEKK